jgi:hypothetical protein
MTDIDLHFARLQDTTCTDKGWDTVCTGMNQDCYWNSSCKTGDQSWGYAQSAMTACHGWGSQRIPLSPCANPRLDRDNISCSRTQADPIGITGGLFCGPENINLDNPRNGDKFLIGVNHYGGAPATKPHVNIYCNGQRVLSVGYNPATGQTMFPVLRQPGGDSTGDFWNVAMVTTNVTGGNLTSCDVATIPSHHADPTRDGAGASASDGTGICVESRMNGSTPPFSYTSHRFVDTGSAQTGLAQGAQPATAADFCKH